MTAQQLELSGVPEKPEQPMVVRDEATAMLEMIERVALNPDVDVEKMERLMAMHDRIQAKRAEIAFNEALVAVKAIGIRIRKTRVNRETQSKYADIDAISDALDPHIAANGLTLTYTAEPLDAGFLNIIADVKHVGGHSERHTFPLPIDTKGPKGGAVKTELHGACSTVTQGRKYLKLMIFDVPTYDDDGNAGGGKVPEFIDEKEAISLREWIESLGRDEAKFCAALDIPNLEAMPKSMLGKARNLLKKAEAAK